MKRSNMIKADLQEIVAINHLTSVLESVSSIRIGQIKDTVLAGRECFTELWKTYTHLRIDSEKHQRFISKDESRFSNGKTLYVVMTSDGSLSGSIDQKIVDYFLTVRETQSADIICIGKHGVSLLRQRGIEALQSFESPSNSDQEQVLEICSVIEPYAKITIYYQSYESISKQIVKSIELISSVATLAGDTTAQADIISSRDFVFEPSLKIIVKTMESTMLQIALREIILDSELAHLASRFVAMFAAEERAKKTQKSLTSSWQKARRDERDKRQRETIASGVTL
ncbi:hypothetical protein EB118_15780 [bacterium]|nr:hypothetical protein [bacterium]NBX97379.1 hypothetical protein [bacterium]NDC95333.1 hypothetical protein [bacterium]NDD85055.1 hypothetical protein [bacterium]NDG31515.1 hypothetical protein [bacterium]